MIPIILLAAGVATSESRMQVGKKNLQCSLLSRNRTSNILQIQQSMSKGKAYPKHVRRPKRTFNILQNQFSSEACPCQGGMFSFLQTVQEIHYRRYLWITILEAAVTFYRHALCVLDAIRDVQKHLRGKNITIITIIN